MPAVNTKRIEPAQRGRQHAGVETDAIDEIVEREARRGSRARLELAHVVADARQAFEAAFVIEQALRPRAALMPFSVIR